MQQTTCAGRAYGPQNQRIHREQCLKPGRQAVSLEKHQGLSEASRMIPWSVRGAGGLKPCVRGGASTACHNGSICPSGCVKHALEDSAS